MLVQINNSVVNAMRLFCFVRDRGFQVVFDLDEVLLDAKHRQKIYTKQDVIAGNCQADQVGQLDLNHYRSQTTKEQVTQDKNLPLIKLVNMLNHVNKSYHVATARVACEHTRSLLVDRRILPSTLICRQDDSDYRRDHVLKCEGFIQHFGTDRRNLSRLLLLDDNERNCLAAKQLGLNAIQIIM